MNERGLADLDELVLQARSQSARNYIAEAVACSKVGAFRSCIVATWIAVVFDVVDKLREMELTGDKNATKQYARFENIRENNDIPSAQKFERELLHLAATDFELLSKPELEELDRLLADRHRCAHPTLQYEGVPYQPSAELARTHLRNAVSYLLSQEPVQGKTALDRILRDIDSEYFPRNGKEAVVQLRAGPLGRPRESLVRSVVLVLTKCVLRDTETIDARERRFAALEALFQMHVGLCEQVYTDDLPKILTNLSDEDWPRAISLVRNVPFAWDAMGDAARQKSQAVVQTPPAESLVSVIKDALGVSALAEFAVDSIGSMEEEELTELVQDEPRKVFVAPALSLLSLSKNFAQANRRSLALVAPLSHHFTEADLHVAIDIFMSNDQVTLANNMPTLFEVLLDSMRANQTEAPGEWQRLREKINSNGFGRSWDALRNALDMKLEDECE